MSILIFGSGFISDNLLRYFDAAGEKAFVIPARRYWQARAEGRSELSTCESYSEPHNIIICAGITRLVANDLSAFNYNVALVSRFLDDLNDFNLASVTFLSSVDVYGTEIDGVRLYETLEKRPQDYYSLSKSVLEEVISFWCSRRNTRHLVLRLSGVYGPGDEGKGTIARLVSDALRIGHINVTSPGTDTRDFVYVDDIASGIEAFMNSGIPMATLNVASGESQSIREIGEYIAKLTGSSIQMTPAEQRTARRASCMAINIDKLKVLFPDHRPTSMVDGIKRYVARTMEST